MDGGITQRPTPLHEAIERRQWAAAELLINKGADDLTARGVAGEPPLFAAVLQGHRATVELLVDKGADPNAAGPGGFTPLGSAVAAARAEMVAVLLVKGADVDGRVNGQTPLRLAGRLGLGDIARILSDHGATE